MQKTYGSKCPSKGFVYKWFEGFNNCGETVIDLHRSGRPKLFEKIDEVKRIIDEFSYSSCRYISHIVGIDKNTVKKILIEDLHMQKVCLYWVPKSFKIEYFKGAFQHIAITF